MQPLAPQAFPATGPAPTLALAGQALDGSPGPWRKEGAGATVAARPQAQFTTLLESLVGAREAGNAPAVKKDAPAVNKENAPRAAFWMAVDTATPQVRHPAKPADRAAEIGDGVLPAGGVTDGRAGAPETSGDAADLVKVAPQSGARLPVSITTPMSDGPDAPEDRPSRDRKGEEFRTTPLNFAQAAVPAMKNGVPDSKPAAGAAGRKRETACGTVADAVAAFRQPAGGGQDRIEAEAGQETTGSPAPGETKVGQTLSSVKPAISTDSSQLLMPGTPIGAGPGGRPAREELRGGTDPRGQTSGGARAESLRVREVAPAGAEVEQAAAARSEAKAGPDSPQPPTESMQDRPGAATEQEAARARCAGLQVSSAVTMVPAQPPATGRPPGPRREGRSPSPGAVGQNRAANPGTVGGQPLAPSAVTGQTAARSQPDANTGESGEEAAPAAGQPAANSVPAALEPLDDAMESSAARPMVVAFTARLRPVETTPEAPGGDPASPVAEPIETAPVVEVAAAAGETAPGGQNNSHATPPASARQPEVSREPVRKPEVSAAGALEPAVTARPATTPQPLAANDARPRESAPASPPPAAATEPPAAPEIPKPAAAHDIKLELAGQGDRRVEVRVSERAGDMRVEVRTPNTGLAGDLRDDLPALATKLEQTGFRAETWHPAGTAERQRAAEAAPGAASQNSERQPGQNGGQRQRDPQQQPKPKAQENDIPSQNRGKDFAWLFSSIP